MGTALKIHALSVSITWTELYVHVSVHHVLMFESIQPDVTEYIDLF
jgi:hypothetical protein